MLTKGTTAREEERTRFMIFQGGGQSSPWFPPEFQMKNALPLNFPPKPRFSHLPQSPRTRKQPSHKQSGTGILPVTSMPNSQFESPRRQNRSMAFPVRVPHNKSAPTTPEPIPPPSIRAIPRMIRLNQKQSPPGGERAVSQNPRPLRWNHEGRQGSCQSEDRAHRGRIGDWRRGCLPGGL